MKKTYIQPAMLAVKLQQMQMLCQSITDLDSDDTGIVIGGEGQGGSNVKAQSIWDNEW